MEHQDCCRLCLIDLSICESEEVKKVIDQDVNSLINYCICLKFNDAVSPQWICLTCWKNLENFKKFKTVCQESYEILHKFCENKVSTEIVNNSGALHGDNINEQILITESNKTIDNLCNEEQKETCQEIVEKCEKGENEATEPAIEITVDEFERKKLESSPVSEPTQENSTENTSLIEGKPIIDLNCELVKNRNVNAKELDEENIEEDDDESEYDQDKKTEDQIVDKEGTEEKETEAEVIENQNEYDAENQSLEDEAVDSQDSISDSIENRGNEHELSENQNTDDEVSAEDDVTDNESQEDDMTSNEVVERKVEDMSISSAEDKTGDKVFDCDKQDNLDEPMEEASDEGTQENDNDSRTVNDQNDTDSEGKKNEEINRDIEVQDSGCTNRKINPLILKLKPASQTTVMDSEKDTATDNEGVETMSVDSSADTTNETKPKTEPENKIEAMELGNQIIRKKIKIDLEDVLENKPLSEVVGLLPKLKYKTKYKGKKYKCGTCGEAFSRQVAKDKHEKEHQLPYKCVLCFESFHSLSRLQKHRKDAHNEDPYYCSFCSQGCANAHAWNKHMNEVHVRCSKCKSYFQLLTDLKAHNCIGASEKPSEGEPNRIRYDFPDASARGINRRGRGRPRKNPLKKAELKKRVLSKLAQLNQPTLLGDINLSTDHKGPEEKKKPTFQCIVCFLQFLTKSDLICHQAAVHPGEPIGYNDRQQQKKQVLFCKHCLRFFDNLLQLQAHRCDVLYDQYFPPQVQTPNYLPPNVPIKLERDNAQDASQNEAHLQRQPNSVPQHSHNALPHNVCNAPEKSQITPHSIRNITEKNHNTPHSIRNITDKTPNAPHNMRHMPQKQPNIHQNTGNLAYNLNRSYQNVHRLQNLHNVPRPFQNVHNIPRTSPGYHNVPRTLHNLYNIPRPQSMHVSHTMHRPPSTTMPQNIPGITISRIPQGTPYQQQKNSFVTNRLPISTPNNPNQVPQSTANRFSIPRQASHTDVSPRSYPIQPDHIKRELPSYGQEEEKSNRSFSSYEPGEMLNKINFEHYEVGEIVPKMEFPEYNQEEKVDKMGFASDEEDQKPKILPTNVFEVNPNILANFGIRQDTSL